MYTGLENGSGAVPSLLQGDPFYTERTHECEKSVPGGIGSTESKQKLLRIFTYTDTEQVYEKETFMCAGITPAKQLCFRKPAKHEYRFSILTKTLVS